MFGAHMPTAGPIVPLTASCSPFVIITQYAMMIARLKVNPELLPPRRFEIPSGNPSTPKTRQANGSENFLWISTFAIR